MIFARNTIIYTTVEQSGLEEGEDFFQSPLCVLTLDFSDRWTLTLYTLKRQRNDEWNIIISFDCLLAKVGNLVKTFRRLHVLSV